MPPQSATVLVHVLMLLLTAHRDVTVSAMLFPFGSEAGDTVYTSEFDMTDAVSLPSPFTFYQTAYSTVYTNEDGFLSFTKSAVVQEIPDDFITLTFPVICIFCADFGTAAQFPILVRLSANVTDLQTVQTLARQFSDFGSSFTPDWVLVVTWDDVPAFFETDPGNTLQLAIASDGTRSLVFMDYDDIGWLDGFSGATNINTRIGMVKGDGTHHYVFPESMSSNISLLVNRTNIGVDGQFLFRVDEGTIPPEPTLITGTITTTTTPTTNAAETTHSTSLQPESASFDATPYYIGIGVSVAVLVLVGISILVFYKAKSSSSIKSTRVMTLTPAPAAERVRNDNNNSYKENAYNCP